MLRIVTFKWKPPHGYRSKFGPETVNILASMCRRHYQKEHEFVCITDDAKGIDPAIRIIPLWEDHAKLKSPMGAHQPSCYRRLKLFSAEAEQFIGPRFVCLDLDTVIVGDMTPLWDRSEEFIVWGDTYSGKQFPKTWYNGSMFMMKAGARRQVWDEFDPVKSPIAAKKGGSFGSDQGWISHKLGPNEATWGVKDGVYSFRVHVEPRGGQLPHNAKVVHFHGKVSPWDVKAQRHAWVREHYRKAA